MRKGLRVNSQFASWRLTRKKNFRQLAKKRVFFPDFSPFLSKYRFKNTLKTRVSVLKRILKSNKTFLTFYFSKKTTLNFVRVDAFEETIFGVNSQKKILFLIFSKNFFHELKERLILSLKTNFFVQKFFFIVELFNFFASWRYFFLHYSDKFSHFLLHISFSSKIPS